MLAAVISGVGIWDDYNIYIFKNNHGLMIKENDKKI